MTHYTPIAFAHGSFLFGKLINYSGMKKLQYLQMGHTRGD